MILHVSVILSTGVGGIPACTSGHMTPRPSGQAPPGQTPPPRQVTPLGRHPPGRHPRGKADTPLARQTPPSKEPPSLRTACLEIRSTSGRYASYWNAILFYGVIHTKLYQRLKYLDAIAITDAHCEQTLRVHLQKLKANVSRNLFRLFSTSLLRSLLLTKLFFSYFPFAFVQCEQTLTRIFSLCFIFYPKLCISIATTSLGIFLRHNKHLVTCVKFFVTIDKSRNV